jgi:type II secretory pathway component PulM
MAVSLSFLTSWKDKIAESQAVQTLKSKWDDLDPQSRKNLSLAGGAAAVVLVLWIFISGVGGTYALRDQVRTKQDILNTLKNANQEMAQLRAAGGGAAGVIGQKPNWAQILASVATQASVDGANMKTGPEKPGAVTLVSDEFLFDVELKHVSIKQVVRFAAGLERDSHPIKLRSMRIETDGPEGYLNARLWVSGFSLKK